MIPFDRRTLTGVVVEGMVGRISISGVQKKVALSLSSDRTALTVSVEGAQYILKPDTDPYPELPANEHLTMRLADLVGIEVPPCGLVPLADGSWAYIVRRFDRPIEGGKLLQEDFCQLAELPPGDKYRGSAELCVRLLRRYASEPLVAIDQLYRLLLFTWWTGNGDMHLKNFSLLRTSDGVYRLTPAYDLVCTALYPRLDDELALPVQGKKKNLTRRTWLDFARHARLPETAARKRVRAIRAALPEAVQLVDRSWLPESHKAIYRRRLERTARQLG
jgi:serine/threonine-protein kinase HipA